MIKLKGILGCGGLILVLLTTPVQAVDMRFSAFGDVVYGAPIGDPADANDAAAFAADGDDPNPVNTHDGFTLSGVDFVVIADVTDRATFLTEINLQAERGASNDLEIDIERMFIDYEYSPSLKLQTGLYFTPIGYFNRFLYSRAWLMNSIQVPDLFEEELNLVPTHTVGINAHGSMPLEAGKTFNYSIGIGNGRATVPDAAVYARDNEAKGKEITWLAELIIPGFRDNRFGISGWFDSIRADKIDTIGGAVTGSIKLSETGINPYVVIGTKSWGLIAEYIYAQQKDELGNLPEDDYELSGFIVEASLRMDSGKLHPFIRYDETNLPDNGGPYYGLRDGQRKYIPEFRAAMVGASYDIDVHTRIKTEYIHHLDGPRTDEIRLQLAYGF